MKGFQIIVTCQRCDHKEFIDNPQKYDMAGNAQEVGFRLLNYTVPKTSLNKGAKVEIRVCRTCDNEYTAFLGRQNADRIAFFEDKD